MPVINTLSVPEAWGYYTEKGIIVHPLCSPQDETAGKDAGKAPITKGFNKLVKSVPANEFTQGRNIGFVCGARSDLTVIDIDFYFKGLWEFIFDNCDMSQFLKQYHTENRWHWLFKFAETLESKQYQELGFDALNEGSNCVAAPSTHKEGSKYQLSGDIEDRSEFPLEAAHKLEEVLKTYGELTEIFKKCRSAWQGLWKAVFVNKNDELYHKPWVAFCGAGDNRNRHLGLCSELLANGAEQKHLILTCWLIFPERYNREETLKNLKGVNPKKTWKNETIEADDLLSRFYKEPKTPEKQPEQPSLKTLSTAEINARKEGLKSRRLSFNLPPTHFLSIYEEWLGGLTDGYEEYQLLGGFWLISALCGDKVELRLKQETIKPNIWIVLLGKSTTSRKSTIVNKTRMIYESTTGDRLPNEDFSIEGYMESLADEPKQHHVRDEAAGFIAKTHKEYNQGFSELECALYDRQSFRKKLASKGAKEPRTFNIKDPYITKLYATTLDNYATYTQMTDFLSGHEYRFLFTLPTYDKPRLPLSVETDTDIQCWLKVLERTKALYNFAQTQNDPLNFGFEPEAQVLYEFFIESLENQIDSLDNGMLASASGRSQIHILKLAMLLELGKDPISTTITAESICQAANAVIGYFLPVLSDLIIRLQEDIKTYQVERVTTVLRRLGGVGTHTKVLHDSKLKSKEFAECINTLLESETIEAVTEEGSRKITYILKDMGTKLETPENFKNPQNPQNLQNLLVSIDPKSQEILETLKKFKQTKIAHVIDNLSDINTQSEKNKSLQNLSGSQTLRDSGTKEILETQEIFGVSSLVVTSEEAARRALEGGL